MKHFSEIYNKRRIVSTPRVHHNPADYYVESRNGSFVRTINDRYVPLALAIDQNLSILRSDDTYSEASSNKVAKFFAEMTNDQIFFEDEKQIAIVGTALAVISSLLEWLVCNKTIWTWFVGLITDGYWMIFTSPFILAYWTIISILWLPIMTAISLLLIISIPYTYIIELPASIMNKDKFLVPGGNWLRKHWS